MSIAGLVKRLVIGRPLTAAEQDSNLTLIEGAVDTKAPIESPTFTGTVGGVTKSMVGLGNCDNTSDSSKPVSTLQAAADTAVADAAALDATTKANNAQAHAIQRGNHTGEQAISTVTGLQAALDGKSATGHGHVIGDTTGLQAALDAKLAAADPSVTNAREWTADTVSQVDAEAGVATTRVAWTVLRVWQAIAAWWAASAFKTKLDGIATGATANATDADLRDRSTHTGTQAAGTITGLATIATTGSASDLSAGTVPTARLGSGAADGTTFLAGDQTYKTPPVTSVNGRTGAVTLAKDDVGLGNVDNTADASKPVSTAQATADTAVATAAATDATTKANAAQAHAIQRGNHTGEQAISTVTGLQAAIDGKAATSHGHIIADTTGLQAALDGKSATGHGHVIADTTGLQAALDAKLAATDPSVTNSREWTADTVSQIEAETGTATTRGAWTVQRVWQAIAAWWAASAMKTKLDGIATGATANATDADLRDRSTHTGTQAAGTITGLATIATSGSASDLSAGTVPTARLGSGTADGTTFLAGDQSYKTPPVTSVDGLTGAVTITKTEVYDFTRSAGAAGSTGAAPGPYTWTIPAGAKSIRVICIAAGAGGGSGRRGAASSARFGGGGGAGGDLQEALVAVAELPSSTLTVNVGGGGAGGAAVTTDDTDGNNGGGGGPSIVDVGNGYAGICFAQGPSSGSGGTNASGGAGVARALAEPGVAGIASSITETPGGGTGTLGQDNRRGGQGGGGGGGIDASNNSRLGGGTRRNGPIVISYLSIQPGNGGSTVGANGTTPTSVTPINCGGHAGGGGAAGDASTAAGNGGNGAYPGGGGGGGGASFNGYSSGAGGNGGDGHVRIVVFY